MNRRRKGKTAKLLVLVMLMVFMCGSTAMAEESSFNGWQYAGSIDAGSYLQGISASTPYPDKYQDYRDYEFFVNGEKYTCDSDGRVFLNRYYLVKDVVIDSVNKAVKVSGEPVIQFWIGNKSEWKKTGDTVTLNLAQVWQQELEENKEFARWYVWAWKSGDGDGVVKKYSSEETASFLGVTVEALQKKECTVTFNIPSEWEEFMEVGIDPSFNKNTVSGNVPSEPDKSGGSNHSQTKETAAAPETEVKKEVVMSDGTTLTSAGAMYNVVRGLNGAAVLTPQQDMNTRAGLTPQEVEAGSNAKLYMGNTYKAAEKALLTEAVSQTGATTVNMINIDLYSIAKSGLVANIKKPAGEEPVRLIIGLPDGAVKEGRSFSLVYMGEDGKAVEIPDLDSDPRTLTVDLTRFGAFAVTYR